MARRIISFGGLVFPLIPPKGIRRAGKEKPLATGFEGRPAAAKLGSTVPPLIPPLGGDKSRRNLFRRLSIRDKILRGN